MAEAEKNVRQAEKVIVEKVPEIILHLTIEEAEYISAILGSAIYGTGELRKLNDSVWNALLSVRIDAECFFVDQELLDITDLRIEKCGE